MMLMKSFPASISSFVSHSRALRVRVRVPVSRVIVSANRGEMSFSVNITGIDFSLTIFTIWAISIAEGSISGDSPAIGI